MEKMSEELYAKITATAAKYDGRALGWTALAGAFGAVLGEGLFESYKGAVLLGLIFLVPTFISSAAYYARKAGEEHGVNDMKFSLF